MVLKKELLRRRKGAAKDPRAGAPGGMTTHGRTIGGLPLRRRRRTQPVEVVEVVGAEPPEEDSPAAKASH